MKLMLALIMSLTPMLAWAQLGNGSNSMYGGGTVTDKSGSIAQASTSQVVMAANTKRVYCEIQSVGTADMRIAIDGTASAGGGSYYLPAGSLFKCPPQTPPTGQISIWSTTVSAPFTATEYAR